MSMPESLQGTFQSDFVYIAEVLDRDYTGSTIRTIFETSEDDPTLILDYQRNYGVLVISSHVVLEPVKALWPSITAALRPDGRVRIGLETYELRLGWRQLYKENRQRAVNLLSQSRHLVEVAQSGDQQAICSYPLSRPVVSNTKLLEFAQADSSSR